MAPEPKIEVDTDEQPVSRAQRVTELTAAIQKLPKPRAATGVVPEHAAAVNALIAKTRGLLTETRRVNAVAGRAAGQMGTQEKQNKSDIASTPQPEYGC